MTDDTPQTSETTTADPARCRCGHDRDHLMVSAEGRYGGWGLFTLWFGITTRPHTVVFRCRRCGQAIEETQDEGVLDRVRDGKQ
jgi:hypothetical protein